jgi:hypothetical protein
MYFIQDQAGSPSKVTQAMAFSGQALLILVAIIVNTVMTIRTGLLDYACIGGKGEAILLHTSNNKDESDRQKKD